MLPAWLLYIASARDAHAGRLGGRPQELPCRCGEPLQLSHPGAYPSKAAGRVKGSVTKELHPEDHSQAYAWGHSFRRLLRAVMQQGRRERTDGEDSRRLLRLALVRQGQPCLRARIFAAYQIPRSGTS